MAKPRKRHVQQELDLRRDKNGQRRGGKRRNAGRPARGKRAGAPHKRRPWFEGKFPQHIVLSVVREIGSLRKRHMYRALREASLTVALRELHDKPRASFRIVHISIQRTHIHLIVEADNKTALSNGMQRFQISAAKHLNREASRGLTRRRRGTVFPDRYHQEIITNPTQARRTLAYVLNNWRKHQDDRNGEARTWNVDPFSTGALFWGWKEREGATTFWRLRERYQPLVVYLPRTWLLREGWKRGGGLIRFREVPSSGVAEAQA